MSDEQTEVKPNVGNNTGTENNNEPLSYEKLEQQLLEMETKNAENFDKFVRTQAEMENLRRRMQRDLEAAHKYSIEKMARELLPILDSLERSLEHEHPDAKALAEGIKMTLSMFHSMLSKFQIQEVNPLNNTFDPKLHEAMSTQVDEKVTPGTVLQVLQKGYLLHDRLLRPALVIVAKGVEK